MHSTANFNKSHATSACVYLSQHHKQSCKWWLVFIYLWCTLQHLSETISRHKRLSPRKSITCLLTANCTFRAEVENNVYSIWECLPPFFKKQELPPSCNFACQMDTLRVEVSSCTAKPRWPTSGWFSPYRELKFDVKPSCAVDRNVRSTDPVILVGFMNFTNH